jgi:hypothetical protein
MNLVVISGSGWTQHQGAVQVLLARLAATGSTDTILVDHEAIRREAVASEVPEACAWPGLVQFSAWMKDARLAEESINPMAILSSARLIPSDQVVVIDARNYSLDLIAAALKKARLAWYPLDQWHPTFGVVTDDVNLLRLLPALAATFYSQPQVLTERESKLIVRGIMRRAFIYRWFGSRAGRMARWLGKLAGRANAVQDRLSYLITNAPKG